MHVYEEDAECRSDSVIECLSWMRCVDTADQRHFLHNQQHVQNQNQNQPPVDLAANQNAAEPDAEADAETNNNNNSTNNNNNNINLNNNNQQLALTFGDDPHESTLRRAYQQASFECGWLACGNARCIVSITQTQLVSTSAGAAAAAAAAATATAAVPHVTNAPNAPDASRSNFNLWGHKHKVIHVRWNEPYQKLASCSQNGVIFVWVKHDGRWSVELINDRNQQVSDFRWSYDGRLALITYADGFVLVGNVNGQRHWSTMLPLRASANAEPSADGGPASAASSSTSTSTSNGNANASNAEPVRLTCGIWTPRNKRVLFGTSAGRLLVVSAQTGHIVADYPVRGARHGIVQLEWNCAAWHLVDELQQSAGRSGSRFAASANVSTDRHVFSLQRPNDSRSDTPSSADRDRDRDSAHDDADGYTLACALANGEVLLLRNADPDELVRCIDTRLERIRLAFSRDGFLLAACGRVGELGTQSAESNEPGDSVLRFYTVGGELVRSYTLLRRDSSRKRPSDEDDAMRRANAVCWAHDDARVFVACGCHVRTFWIRMTMSPLAALTCIAIRRAIGSRRAVTRLPLPSALQRSVDHYFAATIRSRSRLPTALSLREFVCSPPASRLFCTMKRVAGCSHSRQVTSAESEMATSSSGEPKSSTASADAAAAALSPDVCYVLYLEFLGGLIPLLKAKRSSRFRLDFVIYDPLTDTSYDVNSSSNPVDAYNSGLCAYCAECQRSRTARQPQSAPDSCDQRDLLSRSTLSSGESSLPSYDESALRENSPLAAVVANLWGTKFRVCGLQPYVPKALGTVQYKPSLFHLQPRKMTVTVAELNADTLAQQLLARRSVRVGDRSCILVRHAASRGGSFAVPTANDLQPSADSSSPLHLATEPAVADADEAEVDADATQRSAPQSGTRKTSKPRTDFEHEPATYSDCIDFARMKMIDLDGACLTGDSPASRFGAAPDEDYDDEDVAMYIDECITVDVTDVEVRRREHISALRVDVATPTWLRKQQPFSEANRSPLTGDSFAERCGSPSRCLVAPIAPSETLGSLASTAVTPGFLPLDPQPTPAAAAAPVPREADRPTASNACACSGSCQCGASSSSQAPDDATRHANGNRERASLLRRLMRRGGASGTNTGIPSTSKWVNATPLHSVHNDAATTHWLSVPSRGAGSAPSRSAPTTPTHTCTAQIRLNDNGATTHGGIEPGSATMSASHRRANPKQDESVAWRLASLLTPKLVRRRRCHSQQVAANAHVTALCTPRISSKTRMAKRMTFERCVACGRSIGKIPPCTVAGETDEHRSPLNGDGSVTELARESETTPNVLRQKSITESTTSRRSTKLGRKSKVHDGAHPSVTDASEPQRVHVMHNKEPIWNELSQVYQLDFGGRVTQESAKNFQIEFNGEQVLQFGRIGNDSFTLDFQHPFSPVQAFGVALANITQRLK